MTDKEFIDTASKITAQQFKTINFTPSRYDDEGVLREEASKAAEYLTMRLVVELMTDPAHRTDPHALILKAASLAQPDMAKYLTGKGVPPEDCEILWAYLLPIAVYAHCSLALKSLPNLS